MNNPTNEMETIIWFVERQKDYGLDIVKFRPNVFPDATVVDITTNFPREVEFEYFASSFIVHEHDPFLCDLIICWTNDFPIETTFPIFELSSNTLFGDKPSHTNRNEIYKHIRYLVKNRKINRERRSNKEEPEIPTKWVKNWRRLRPTLTEDMVLQIAQWSANDIHVVSKEQNIEERTLINWRTYAKREVEMKNVPPEA